MRQTRIKSSLKIPFPQEPTVTLLDKIAPHSSAHLIYDSRHRIRDFDTAHAAFNNCSFFIYLIIYLSSLLGTFNIYFIRDSSH